MLPGVSAKPCGLLVSGNSLARYSDALAAAAREGGIELEHIVVPDDPEARIDADACARIELAYFSGDVFPERSRAFFAAALNAPALRWLQVFNAGVDHPVFQRFVEKGIRLTTAAGSSAEPIAQTAFAGLLMLARGFPHWLDGQARRAWEPTPLASIPADLRGQTLVVFGLGAIGTEIARLARAFGLRVIGVRRRAAVGDEPVDELYPPERLPELLPRADWLALACALTDETRNAIDAVALALLPKTARLLNVSRGGVVDEPALIAALRDGRIAGAYLDVFAEEPLPRESPLWTLPNVIVTPHNSSVSRGNERRAAEIFLRNLARYGRGEPLLNEVRA
jgi:phosphoglycerate dehydrogenase-like enzyme